MIRFIAIASLCLFLAEANSEPEPTSYLTGNPQDAQPSSKLIGGYALMGGGGDVDEAFRWLLKRAFGGDVVVIRASGSDGYNPYFFSELGVKVDSVQSLVFKNQKQAFAQSTRDALSNAELIFIAGGDQSKYIRFWKDTPVEELLNQHVASGKPIGGTSAGLAILGELSYSAMHQGNLTSALALKYPNHRYITIENDFLKLPGLETILTDTHFSERDRMGRLITMLRFCHLNQLAESPIGLGIDEATALCLDEKRNARVFSARGGKAHFVRLENFEEDSFEGTNALITSLGPHNEFKPLFSQDSLSNLVQIRAQIKNSKIEYAVFSDDD
ncbi:MAG: cyanophycinase [Verrucomicrobiota bacterium]